MVNSDGHRLRVSFGKTLLELSLLEHAKVGSPCVVIPPSPTPSPPPSPPLRAQDPPPPSSPSPSSLYHADPATVQSWATQASCSLVSSSSPPPPSLFDAAFSIESCRLCFMRPMST
jgi:hypothetical protein